MDQRRIGELLQEAGAISASDIEQALAYQRETPVLFGQALLRLGAVAEERLLAALSDQLGLPLVPPGDLPREEAAYALAPAALGLPLRWLGEKGAVLWWAAPGGNDTGFAPLDGEAAASASSDTAQLVVFARNPLDPGLNERLGAAWSGQTRMVLGPNRLLESALARLQSAGARTRENALTDVERLREMAEEAPVIDFVNAVFEDALRDGASDIHIEPFEHEFQVRFRVDGVLRLVQTQPKSRFDAVASRIKLVSAMDIAERRLPQDGRQTVRFAGQDIDLRVSSLPGAWGESLVLRLLRKRQELPSLDGLGLMGAQRQVFNRVIREPNGVILVTGPTGSGKSTTLYRALELVNDGQRKIITIEDPVEYDMDGVTQVQARADIGYDFARGLRAILRQDPDVIMIGEIRDGETARIAIQAALTGHLVFSTLHTNTALGAIERLTDLGVEPFLVSASLRGLLAQRLLRRLCTECAAPAPPDAVSAAERLIDQAAARGVRWPAGALSEPAAWRVPAGCDACRGQGYTGRIAVYEAAAIDGAVKEAIAQNAGQEAILDAARRAGFLSMLEDGLLKARAGTTSISEAMRVLGGAGEDPGLAGAPHAARA
ncbi:GspE/PulE family protein [Maricaulis sp.]|uniref:GspE/PulE family protein n=1 Tax=Maricaulis sp. TaxID=1486257 RepID=UPI0026089AA5|nr:type II/IV secretion system protein [Maricaulis sp.]